MTDDDSLPWNISPFVTTVRWVKTQDGRDIPLRYSEVLDNGKVRIVIEVWPHYPVSYQQAVFGVELTPHSGGNTAAGAQEEDSHAQEQNSAGGNAGSHRDAGAAGPGAGERGTE